MRPLRFLFSLVACIVTFSLLLYLGRLRTLPREDFEESSRLGAYFSWRTPSSLFPPSAIISLTDDNSTFFLARPAAFGPSLPARSLSGQLWVGSGFGDDHLGRSGAAGNWEGELGCSDVAGWNDVDYRNVLAGNKKAGVDVDAIVPESQDKEQAKRSIAHETEVQESAVAKTTTTTTKTTEDDGTDDYFQRLLPVSDTVRSRLAAWSGSKKATHADIQSLQESAEIAGKVVLLSRGGCGFLEKVKWAQRRGGVAVIVGDDIRGGPLVTMYARGDTSNVTIPALFTSHTTAHLLSSLMPIGSGHEVSPEAATRLGLAFGEKAYGSKAPDEKNGGKEKAKTSTTNLAGKSTPTQKARVADQKNKSPLREPTDAGSAKDSPDWPWSILGSVDAKERQADSRHAPSSGSFDWIVRPDFDDKEVASGKKVLTSGTSPKAGLSKRPNRGSSDGFVIGVQDWRDPDLVAEQKEKQTKQGAREGTTSGSQALSQKTKLSGGGGGVSKGGSITPGSGEYNKATHHAVDVSSKPKREKSKKNSESKSLQAPKENGRTWFGRLIKSDPEEIENTQGPTTPPNPSIIDSLQPVSNPVHLHDIHIPHASYDEITEHEGLWVTLTPTSMSSSPFFDTLLVLVVSPLVTLTVVYALLLLRSRIRRRRWRAPKSIVERLPVRTYQTMASSPVSSTTSSVSTQPTVITPLLPGNSPRPIRPRPRSRTTSEVAAQASSSLQSLDQVEEKREAGLAEWRRKYGGKQRECVVCLEEYVDGVSRVMSLPCGHEFHEGCITPWLTTRRRTCPICKGDVVRSLARSQGSRSPSSAIYPHREEEDEDEIQEQAALLTNDDPASQQPIGRDDEAFEDLERGMGGPVDRDR